MDKLQSFSDKDESKNVDEAILRQNFPPSKDLSPIGPQSTISSNAKSHAVSD
jgi:hypothetical protein